jgi:RimJ/RimL family protein N-acetyltransferase
VIPLPLVTERLLLRRFDAADAEAMAAVYLDPEVMRYVAGGVFADRAAVAESLAREAAAQDERGFAVWAVVERKTGRVIGDAGLGVHEPLGRMEAGWTLARAAWGRGYATEAAKACVEAAFANLAVDELVALVDEENGTSIRVAEKAGFVRAGRVDRLCRPHVLLAQSAAARPG